uniref:uncharacterized protein zgc:112980 isoform X2 n=1 Tax=Doryrhamphus excisus TaxID=161450 RepID=UPI0025AE9021|nr:uncharacterized protein zgc:112980 isoform X2 [Doryrhamphus excisus]
MCTAVDNGEIIILSDDDVEDDNRDASCCESSVVILETEDVPRKDCPLSPSKMNEDLVVTFTRPAELLPHARYDCPIHPFTATDNCIDPVSGNEHRCEQCFCYICDKLASTCEKWLVSQVCHCNSHKKSDFWNALRNGLLMGQLEAFQFTLSEMDDKLRHAESQLQIFKFQLKDNFTLFLQGKSVNDSLVYDYTPVYECVSSFLNQADEEDDRAAAVMRLAAAEAFIQHVRDGRVSASQSPFANVNNAKVALMQRVVGSLQRQMVMADFLPCFRQKLQDFYSKLHFPPELKNMRLSLSVRPWDDVLLVSVLKGQNVLGVRTNKGKKDTMLEDMAVILLRVERLLEQKRFRELSRYLRAVHSDQPKRLLRLKDLIPFFMCLDGDFTVAQGSFLIANGPASRLTPQLFLLYLRTLSTAMAPKWTISQTCELCSFQDEWAPIEGAAPLTILELVRFTLEVHRCCLAVRVNSECWIYLLQIVQDDIPFLPDPSQACQQEAVQPVNSILHNESSSKIQIPPHFVSHFPDRAMLLLATGAFGQVILHPDLSPVNPILCTFQKKQWALRWLWNYLLPSHEHRIDLIKKIYQELENHAGVAQMCFPIDKLLFPAAKDWVHRLELNDLLPFLISLEGNFPVALKTLFPQGNGPVSRLTPHLFQFYLQTFNTATVAKLSLCYEGRLCSVVHQRQPIDGAVPLSRLELVRFAIMAHRCSPMVHMDSQSWVELLEILSTPEKKCNSLSEPSGVFLQEAVQIVNSILWRKSNFNMKIPHYFLSLFPDQAMLLLVVGALNQLIVHPDLSPIIPILCTFKPHIMWALNWFWNQFLPSNDYRIGIIEKIYQELEDRPGDASVCLQSSRQVLFPPAQIWDHHMQLSDLLPFLLCLEGRFTTALQSFFPPETGLVSRVLPHKFRVYLYMLGTNTAPKLTIGHNRELCYSDKTWGQISGETPLPLSHLVCFVLQVHRCNPRIHTDSNCWVSLLNIVGGAYDRKWLSQPCEVFLREAVRVVNVILQTNSGGIVQIPRHFLLMYCDQALLLLVTEALRRIICHPDLSPIIPILLTFERNMWALCWFWNLCDDSLHAAIMQKIYQELQDTTEDPASSLTSIRHLLDHRGRHWEQ